MITPIYAAVLTFVFIGLSVRVIRLRRKYKIALGANRQPELLRAIRVQANFSEYVPLAIILLFMLEQLTTSSFILHSLGIILLCGRLLHCYGLSRASENLAFRISGMAMTFFVLASSSILLILKSL